jgi:hypothetical protein
MTTVRTPTAGLALLALSLAWPTVASAQPRMTMPSGPARPLSPAALAVLPAEARDAVGKVMQQATLSARAGTEEFVSRPEMYRWLLDHPDRVSKAWRRLGVACTDISDQGNGQCGWRDAQGSQLAWKPVWVGPEGRIWYAEGLTKPGAMLPTVPVKAVAVLRHSLGASGDETGRSVIRHQVDIFIQTDSKAAALVMRMLGPAAPRMAEQGAGQLLLFFSLMARHLDRHPEQAETLLAATVEPFPGPSMKP